MRHSGRREEEGEERGERGERGKGRGRYVQGGIGIGKFTMQSVHEQCYNCIHTQVTCEGTGSSVVERTRDTDSG